MNMPLAIADEGNASGFSLPDWDQLTPIFTRVWKMPEFEEVREAEPAIDWLMRHEPKIRHNKAILGECHVPSVNGALSGVFDWLLERTFGRIPDFLIVLDAGYWVDASDLQREILVFHELSHCTQAKDAFGSPRFNKQTGEPIFGLQGHDIEEFNQVVRRYGAHRSVIDDFVQAVQDGEANVFRGRPLRQV